MMVFLRQLAWFVSMLLCACLFEISGASAATGKRLALVIGNDAYQYVGKLEKAGNDATAMARELRAAGFEVTLERDINYRNMVRRIEFFTSHVKGGDQVVVFFSGHGVQLKSGSYLLPVDIEAYTESEVEKTSYALNDLMDKLNEAKASFSLVMVDACRTNPFKSSGRALGAERGLLPPDPPKGQMVVYSASKGQQALDKISAKDNNPNGVFTREFVARMRKPGVSIETLVREVQDAVENLARTIGHDQRPALYNEARGDFYFYGPTTVQVQPGLATSASPARSKEQIEDEFWDSIKGTSDVSNFDIYLKSYPTGRYVGLAQLALKKAQVSESNVPPPSASVPTQAQQPGKVFKDCADCPEMVVIPAGSFEMGPDGSTQHVRLSGFAIGKYEVTRRQWLAFMDSYPGYFKECGLECPVEQVSWNEVQEFIRRINLRTDKAYRLPGEAEWEYACRAGLRQQFCGSESLADIGWFDTGADSTGVHRVGGKRVNAFGLYDMSGNVWEWTQDCWELNSNNVQTDGAKAVSFDCDRRVRRGGAWNDFPANAGAASRNRTLASDRSKGLGFRLAVSLP